MKQTKECCETCKNGYYLVCENPKCKCHSPKFSSSETILKKISQENSKGQEGDIKEGSKEVSGNTIVSPSSFNSQLLYDYDTYASMKELIDYWQIEEESNSTDLSIRLAKFIKRVNIKKSIVERDYVTREEYRNLAESKYHLLCSIKEMGDTHIEKQKVIDVIIPYLKQNMKDEKIRNILKNICFDLGYEEKELKL